MVVHMGSIEGFARNGVPMFDGSNYAFWSARMSTYIMSLGLDVWRSVDTGYTIPSTHPTDVAAKRAFEINATNMNVILNGLLETIFVKVMHCDSAHKI